MNENRQTILFKFRPGDVLRLAAAPHKDVRLVVAKCAFYQSSQSRSIEYLCRTICEDGTLTLDWFEEVELEKAEG